MISMTYYHSTHSTLLETGSSICVPTIPVHILGGTLCLAVVGVDSASLVPTTALPSIERGRTGAGTELRKITGTGLYGKTAFGNDIGPWQVHLHFHFHALSGWGTS